MLITIGPKRSIFYSTGGTMKRISLDTDDLTGFMLPVKFVNITENFAFDVTTNHIYWTDGTKIYSSRSNGSSRCNYILEPVSSIWLNE
jgi:hypothetical protein